MAKEPKPYTLKQRRGERPYQYSTEYYASKGALDGEARRAWMRRFSPARHAGFNDTAA